MHALAFDSSSPSVHGNSSVSVLSTSLFDAATNRGYMCGIQGQVLVGVIASKGMPKSLIKDIWKVKKLRESYLCNTLLFL